MKNPQNSQTVSAAKTRSNASLAGLSNRSAMRRYAAWREEFFTATGCLHEPVHTDEVRQVRLAGVRYLFHSQPDQKVGQMLEPLVHGFLLRATNQLASRWR